MKKITAIINPVSGTVSKKRIPILLDKYIPSDIFEKQYFFTEYHGHAFELASKAVEENVDYVIAVGGDGTVNEVAKALINSNSTLGIIPMGSGNGLARDLAIPLDIRKALEVIPENNITTIDYCKANNHIFFCTCGVGFDALISERFAEEKHRGPWSYIKNIISEYYHFQPDIYEITLDNNEVLTETAFIVTCANASQYGNNAFIAPYANMSDGIIDITIISPIGLWDVTRMIFQIFTKQITKNNKTQYYKSKSLTLKRKNAGLIHIDGEPIHVGKKITIDVCHNGLRVLTPQNPMPIVYNVPSFFNYVSKSLEKIKPNQK